MGTVGVCIVLTRRAIWEHHKTVTPSGAVLCRHLGGGGKWAITGPVKSVENACICLAPTTCVLISSLTGGKDSEDKGISAG